jgi:carbohydrate-selective porin OprB
LAHDAETVLEAYWAWGISKWMTITPDVQFYINPALNSKSDTATVFSLRASVFF